jgi:uncharacterized repeat protein (TIGR02543 family)
LLFCFDAALSTADVWIDNFFVTFDTDIIYIILVGCIIFVMAFLSILIWKKVETIPCEKKTRQVIIALILLVCLIGASFLLGHWSSLNESFLTYPLLSFFFIALFLFAESIVLTFVFLLMQIGYILHIGRNAKQSFFNIRGKVKNASAGKKRKILVFLGTISIILILGMMAKTYIKIVTYDMGEGSGKAPSRQIILRGSSVMVPNQGDMIAPQGMYFNGWYGDGTLFPEGSGHGRVNDNITFTANWDELITITFNTNGGTPIESIKEFRSRRKISNTPTTTKEGYAFLGWYTDKELTISFTESKAIYEDITLYAKWILPEDLFPRIMYVTSKEGLNQRKEPSLNSEKDDVVFLFGAGLIIVERGEKAVIDGISDYWYKTNHYEGRWVFGGYLSEEFPADLPAIVGNWNVEGDDRQMYFFSSDHNYWEGYKSTDIGIGGTWSLEGNTLTLAQTYAMAFQTIDPPDVFDIQIEVINRNRIILHLYNEDRILIRNDKP